MFLTALQQQNESLINTALMLLRQGNITPDTYVIDVDMVEYNARNILKSSQKYQLTPYVMTKQFGRNPWLTKRIINTGYCGAVAVDFREAYILASEGIAIKHIGHLVQVPEQNIARALDYQPDVITIFSIEKARQINEICCHRGIIQPVLLKIYQQGDLIYAGQEGGFLLDELAEVVRLIRGFSNLRLAGVTHFPCILATDKPGEYRTTENLSTLAKCVDQLRACGAEIWQVNAPSANCCGSMPLLAANGVTHIEPGHAFTGTIPSNRMGTETEQIAMLYITEVSHQADGNSYCYGGGYYRRGNASHALVFMGENTHTTEINPLDAHSIDYYLSLKGDYPVGTPVVMCFRTQIFVTRSHVALVTGIQHGNVTLTGIYGSQGQRIQ